MATSFLSKYVLSKLREALNMSDAKKLYTMCTRLNPSMEGWAFEELVRQFFATNKGNGSVKMRLRHVGVKGDEKAQQYEVINIADFTCDMKSPNVVGVFSFADNTNLDGAVDAWPEKWNFPTLDHLRLRKIGRVACVESRVLACPPSCAFSHSGDMWFLICFQDTIQEKHSANEHLLRSLHAALKIVISDRGETIISEVRELLLGFAWQLLANLSFSGAAYCDCSPRHV
jgi:hypothetical protein